MPITLETLGVVCSLGADSTRVRDKLTAPDHKPVHLTCNSQWHVEKHPMWVGEVTAPLPPMQAIPSCHQSRNNQLALAAYQQISHSVDSWKAQHSSQRLGVIIGTSTSGIASGESAVAHFLQQQHWPHGFHYSKQEMSAPADFLAYLSDAKGPVYSVSTACTSGAKALASARALISAGIIDAAICGGVDSLSGLPINGFSALEAVSKGICRPFDAHRDGINLGEGAALFFMTKNPQGIALSGVGESSDAYHISSPHPEGAGAQAAMNSALRDADCRAKDISYLNLHGTATVKNDEMESAAVARVFSAGVPCSSTKHLTGHTLGAAGALEAAFCWLLMKSEQQQVQLPRNHTRCGDPNLPALDLVETQTVTQPKYCMSNSFAFGGNNISLILEHVYDSV
ncbi:beta-ketoacyl-ACP synthase [Alteromonas sp. C1M14]|uniref:beta-ketoacyl-ACP synthase n=1 Tax=Alteromonas sp. C1M14 TaxID=2841567 RepID=UPI001C09882A|nr:beta-ketoacyl-ACP synthase [Alteromonas sp. C1M14]MBU2979668.1 beta-ketoacyl-ACP synthase [Alteromonas sp. C1M14]